MAVSGASSAYYRSNASVHANLYAAYTRHLFVKSSIAPSTSNFRTVAGQVGTSGQEPHEHCQWSHTNGAFNGSNYHRSSNGSYQPAQMTLANLTTGNWHSIAAAFDGTNLRSYLNGTLDGTSSAGSASDNRNVWIDFLASITSAGGLDSSSQFVEGEGAELAVWNVALTATEIASLSKGFRAPRIRPASLVFYAPLVRNLVDVRSGLTLVKQAGTDVYSDHPRVF